MTDLTKVAKSILGVETEPTLLEAAESLLRQLEFSCGPNPVWKEEMTSLRTAIDKARNAVSDGR